MTAPQGPGEPDKATEESKPFSCENFGEHAHVTVAVVDGSLVAQVEGHEMPLDRIIKALRDLADGLADGMAQGKVGRYGDGPGGVVWPSDQMN